MSLLESLTIRKKISVGAGIEGFDFSEMNPLNASVALI